MACHMLAAMVIIHPMAKSSKMTPLQKADAKRREKMEVLFIRVVKADYAAIERAAGEETPAAWAKRIILESVRLAPAPARSKRR